VYRTTSLVDVRLDYLKSAPGKLKHRGTFRLHSATFEVAAKVILFDKNSLEPGESDFAQIRLAHPVLLLNGDSFILRSSSPSLTVGGGSVLDPLPPSRRRRSREALELLETLAAGEESGIVSKMVSGSKLSGISFSDILKRTGFSAKRLESALAPLLASGEILQVVREPKIYLGRDGFTTLCNTLLHELEGYLDLNPLKAGISKEELKTRIPARSDQRYFAPCITSLEKEGLVVSERELVKLVARKSTTTEFQSATGSLLEERLKQKQYEPESIKELAAAFKLSEKQVLEHLNLLARENRAIKVKGDLFYAVEPYHSIVQKISGHLSAKGEITPNEFRELTGLSRKYFIPLLEHFDEIKLTIRVGDKRVLRQSRGVSQSAHHIQK
jgi:selenocysteine-specific elongation factor